MEMYCEENYIEDEGCCNTFKFKLRKKKHFIMITLLLVSAIVSILAGLYNGHTLKKYSDLTLIVGIYLPSFILVVVCIYIAFVCGQESFRSFLLPRIRNFSGRNNSQGNQDAVQNTHTNSTQNNVQMAYEPVINTKSLNDSLPRRYKEQSYDKICYAPRDSTEFCETQVSRKFCRSFNHSDISKQMYRNKEVPCKKQELCRKVSYRSGNDNPCSPRFRRHQNANQRKEFKRSVSDTTNKNRNAKFREDRYIWNTQSLDKLKRHVDKINSLEDTAGQGDCEQPSYEVIRKPKDTWRLRPLRNYKNTEYEAVARISAYDDSDKRFGRSGQERIDVSPQEDIRKKNCNTKSELRLYSSSVLKPPYEYKQTLQLTSFQPWRKYITDPGDMTSCSSSGDEKNSSFSRSDTLEMERRINRLESFPSEQDVRRVRRKTIYFPYTGNKEMKRASKDYAHEYCSYSSKKNKMESKPFSRYQKYSEIREKDKQIRYHYP